MKITLLYQVSHYIRVKKQRNTKSWDQQNYLVIRGFCYIRPLYNEVPLYIFRSQITSAYNLWNQMQFPFLTYGVVLHINNNIPTKTITLRKSIYMLVSRASERRNFSHFHILTLLFLSIFCWFFRYFVGTNDMLVGLDVPTYFQMYRQNFEKTLLGPPPPPPPGYAND